MYNYVLLYTGGHQPASETERKKFWDEWNTWYKKLDKAVIDQGYMFSPEVKNIGTDGRISDGPIGTMATGYTIIKAISLDAAVQLAKNCPALRNGAKISVYETVPTMA